MGTLKLEEQIKKSDKEWKEVLNNDQFIVLRQKGTEAPFTGRYYANKEKGVYICAACGQELFSSDAKYDSGSGWPSFFKPVSDDKVALKEDNSHFMERIEVVCSRCGSHMGHVFDDGPEPTGKRYCINSVSLDFRKEE